jgi:PKD repeat protein
MRQFLWVFLVLQGAALASTATTIAFKSNNNQYAPAGSTLPTSPSVLVTDSGGNPVSGVSVTFAVASGGGSITGPSQSTDVNGVAAPTSWTLGPAPGANTLSASSTGLTGSPVTLTATGTGPATTLAIFTGNGESSPVLFRVQQSPCVIVTDAGGTGVMNVAVTFTVTGGGGSIAGPTTVFTDNLGVAFINSWIMGPLPGLNTLSASSAGLSGSPLTFTATGTAPIAINSGPVASDLQPDTGEVVTFTAGANLAGSTFNWDFGDGSTDTSGNTSVQHSFAAPGAYTITATAINGTQQTSAVVNITVYQPLPMTVSKKSIAATNPSKSKDVAQFSGTVTFPSGTTKLPGIVIVQFGSFSQSFTLVKGTAKIGTSQFRFSAKNGVLSAPVNFKIKLTGNLLTVLSNAGLTLGTSGSVSIPLRLVFFGTSNSADSNLNFSIKASPKSERGS